jgi:hypothetical protein
MAKNITMNVDGAIAGFIFGVLVTDYNWYIGLLCKKGEEYLFYAIYKP